jgi:hypothetical protein
MKTAMQELMDYLDDTIPKSIKEQYLEKEKEQIVDAYRIASINNAPNKDISKYTSEYWQVNAELWYDKYFKKN